MKKNLIRVNKRFLFREHEKGLGLISLLFIMCLVLSVVFLGLKVFPILSEKSKVDMALEHVSESPGSGSMNIQAIASSLEKHLNINYVTSLKRKDILNALKVKNTKNGKQISFRYYIERDILEKWMITYKYENVVFTSQTVH